MKEIPQWPYCAVEIYLGESGDLTGWFVINPDGTTLSIREKSEEAIEIARCCNVAYTFGARSVPLVSRLWRWLTGQAKTKGKP